MIKNDYFKIIDSLAKEVSSLDILNALKDEITKDLTTLETLTNENKNLNEKVADLRDTNLKLFLKTGTEIKEEEVPVEKTETELFNDFLKDTFGGNE